MIVLFVCQQRRREPGVVGHGRGDDLRVGRGELMRGAGGVRVPVLRPLERRRVDGHGERQGRHGRARRAQFVGEGHRVIGGGVHGARGVARVEGGGRRRRRLQVDGGLRAHVEGGPLRVAAQAGDRGHQTEKTARAYESGWGNGEKVGVRGREDSGSGAESGGSWTVKAAGTNAASPCTRDANNGEMMHERQQQHAR